MEKFDRGEDQERTRLVGNYVSHVYLFVPLILLKLCGPEENPRLGWHVPFNHTLVKITADLRRLLNDQG